MAQSKQYSTTKKPTSRRGWLKPAGLILLGLIVVVAALELTNTTHFFHKEKAISSTIAPATKTTSKSSGANATKSDTSTSNTDSTTSDNPKDSSPTNPSAALVAPYGNFVSNHHPGENGSPSVETSICMTTPGAKCSIRFVSQQDPTVVKTLAAGIADSTGAVYWNNWDVKDAGFSNGAWDIQVVATLGSQTLTTQDKISFQVSL